MNNPFLRWALTTFSLTVGHCSEAMSALECLTWRVFDSQKEDMLGTEGKSFSGIPRFDGEASRLAEYSFRVKLLEARTKAMDKDEVKKQGPLGLRLVEGLRGQALQVAKTLDVDKLGSNGGPKLLLDALYNTFRPRRQQEARELYNAGAQVRGVLSRQAGESMTSFCLRRRTWYSMLLDLDDQLKLPDQLLAEQTLSCANLGYDHQLMIRTSLGNGGKLSVNGVMDELIAQHAHIHEHELKRQGMDYGKGRGKGGRFPSRSHKPWQSYHAEDEQGWQGEQWDSHSQSLGGCEDDLQSSYHDSTKSTADGDAYYNNEEHYEHYEDEEPYIDSYANLVEYGLDEQNAEAIEYAAEIIQIENESYYAHRRAHQAGYFGYGKGKGKGRMSPEEKRARIEALKKRTTCRRCGQTGHWSTDAVCPKNRGKSFGKGPPTSPSSGSSSSQPQKGGKSPGKGAQKPRVVYFTVNEHEQWNGEGPPGGSASYMAMRGNGPGSGSDLSADELLDRAIAEHRVAQLSQGNAALPAVPETDMDFEDDDFENVEPMPNPGAMMVQPFNVFGQVPPLPARASPIEMPTPNSVAIRSVTPTPTSPLPTPTSPMPTPSTPAIHQPDEFHSPAGSGCSHQRITRAGSNAYVSVEKCLDCGVTLNREKKEPRSSKETRSESECPHVRKDFRGTSATSWQWKCKDCGLKRSGRKEPGQSGQSAAEESEMSASSRGSSMAPTTPMSSSSHGGGPGPQGPPHQNTVDARHVLDLMDTALEIQGQIGGQVGPAQLDVIYNKCKSQVFGSGYASGANMSRTASSVRYSPTANPPSPTPSATSRASSTRSTASFAPRDVLPEDLEAWQHETIKSGVHDGMTFQAVIDSDARYCAFIVERYNSGRLKETSLIEFARYLIEVQRPHQRPSQAMMAKDETLEDKQEQFEEDDLLAVIDTGCNNTCHGSEWAKRYMELLQIEIPLEPTEGNYVGVGGKIQVIGKRRIPVVFQLANGGEGRGVIVSTELGGSSAPLLLSTRAQRTLGLTIDLGAHDEDVQIYSKQMNDHLQVVNRGGLPALRLLPGDFSDDNMVLLTVETENEHTPDHKNGQEEPVQLCGSEDERSEKSSTSTDKIEEDHELSCLALEECSIKVLSKGQKKQLQSSMESVEKEDTALWCTLKSAKMMNTSSRKSVGRGCKTFLMELFAGAATLTWMAASWGFPVSEPVDILYNPEFDLLKPENRLKMERRIEFEDPFLLSVAPLCGPWSPMQRINLVRGGDTAQKIMEDRKAWYPVVKWLTKVIRDRLERGREVLMENPYEGLMWNLKCVDDLMSESPYNKLTGEYLELMKIDQCQYGLKDFHTGLPHRKSTGLLTASSWMKLRLQRRCQRDHQHVPIEGSNLSKASEQWPPELCEQILGGAYDEMIYGTVNMAFPAELEAEEHEDQGPFDQVYKDEDLAPLVKRKRLDDAELGREEDVQEKIDADLLMKQEEKRRQNWIRLPREKRLALRRLHCMTGHCSHAAMTRMLKAAGADHDVVTAVRYFQCQVCRETAKEEKPNVTKPPRPASAQRFNYEVSGDVFEVHDCEGARHSILSLVDVATKFHVAGRVAGGGVPSSRICAQVMNDRWLSWAGAPDYFVCDQGVHNHGKFSHLLTSQGTTIRQIGVRAPNQLGTGERHGGLLKDLMKKVIQERQIRGAEEIAALCSECARVKNGLLNHGGYTPSQWVMGFQPDDRTSLMNHDFDENIGVHQNLVDVEHGGEEGLQDRFQKQLLMRQFAKQAFMEIDASQRIRKTMLRKSVPMRGPYRPGDLVSFLKKDKWLGPARVLANEGKSSLWLVHNGVTILAAETACRPATSSEVLRKQVLELKPSRKRRRMIYQDHEDEEELPFTEDFEAAGGLRGIEQSPYVDLQDGGTSVVDAPPSGGGLVPLDRPSNQDLHGAVSDEAVPAALPPVPALSPVLSLPPGLDQHAHEIPIPMDVPEVAGEGAEFGEGEGIDSSPINQPEMEVSPEPGTSTAVADQGGEVRTSPAPDPTPLTTALRRGTDRLDGHFSRGSNRINPYFTSFLAGRTDAKYKKKSQKKGAGKELIFAKELAGC